MKKLLLLITLIYNLLASQEINFTKIEKEYISSKTVTFGMMVNNYPFSFQENNTDDGFSYDYINLIIQKSGLKIDIQTDTWISTLNKFKNKQIDMIDVISHTKSREAFTNFSKPYFEIPNVVFARKNDFNHYTGMSSLQGKKVGLMEGIFYYETIKNLALFEIEEFKTSKDLIDALGYGKVDAIIDNVIVGQEFIKKAGYTNIKILEEIESSIIKKEDLRLGIKKEDKVLFSIINKTMAAITREEKEILYDKWFTAKVEPKSENNTVQLSNNEVEWLAQDNVVKIWIGNIPPFQIYDNGQFDGISVEYISKIFTKYNIKYKFITSDIVNWKEALEDIGDKIKIDLLMIANITPQRERSMLFTDTYLSSPWVIFTKNDADFISGIKDLNKKTVSVPEGFVIKELLETNYPQINLKVTTGANSIQKAMKAVALGDADAFIENLTVGSYITKSLFLDNIKVAAPTPFGNHKHSMAIRDDWKPLVSIINKELGAMSIQDKDMIYNKYLSMKYEYGLKLFDVIKWIAIVSFIFVIIVVFIVKSNRKLNNEIEKRTKSEEKLLKTNILLEKLSDNVPGAIYQYRLYLDGSSKFPYVSRGIENIYEVSRNDVLFDANLVFKNLHPDDLDMIITSIEESAQTLQEWNLEYRVNLPKKGLRWIHGNAKPEKLEDGSILWHGIINDITEQIKKDQLLSEQTRLASMGEMIGNIAHQWRQPLSAISTGATGIMMEKEYGVLDESKLIETCSIINNNAQYLSKTIEDFTNFIKGERTKKIFDLDKNMDSFLNLVDGSIKTHNIIIIKVLEKDIQINGYENELNQCFINIFNNAKDALKENINTPGIRYLFITAFEEEDKIIIKIKDNGGGIPENILNKIFEPYFTTKHKSLGTGLGLHMTYSLIVDGMGGTIDATNISYKYDGKNYNGAEFTITLPLVYNGC